MLTRLLNQYRRDIIKPTLPLQLVKIAESAGDSSAYLFGESSTETSERLRINTKTIIWEKGLSDS